MVKKQSVISQEGSTVLFEVWKWDTKINLSWPCIPSDYELESTFRLVVDVSLVEFPLVIHSNFVIMAEEVGNAFLSGGIAWWLGG